MDKRFNIAINEYVLGRAELKKESQPGSIKEFKEAGSVDEWASKAMRWRIGSGIVGGKQNGILDPKGARPRQKWPLFWSGWLPGFRNDLADGIQSESVDTFIEFQETRSDLQ